MTKYLEYVCELTAHPKNLLDLLPAMQLVLFVACSYYMIKAFIGIYKDNKQFNNGKK